MSVLNSENYCIPLRHRLLGQTTIQPLRNSGPQKPESISNFEGRGPTLISNLTILRVVYTENTYDHG